MGNIKPKVNKLKSQTLAAEFHAGKYKGCQAAEDDHHTSRRYQHDEQAVPQHLPERVGRILQDRHQVLPTRGIGSV